MNALGASQYQFRGVVTRTACRPPATRASQTNEEGITDQMKAWRYGQDTTRPCLPANLGDMHLLSLRLAARKPTSGHAAMGFAFLSVDRSLCGIPERHSALRSFSSWLRIEPCRHPDHVRVRGDLDIAGKPFQPACNGWCRTHPWGCKCDSTGRVNHPASVDSARLDPVLRPLPRTACRIL
jgi:hypothetical protein